MMQPDLSPLMVDYGLAAATEQKEMNQHDKGESN